MKRKLYTLILTGLLISITVYAFWQTPITKYKPKNDEERALAQLFVKYITSRNSRDVDRFLSTLHEGCEYMVTKDFIATKDELGKILPALWMQNDNDTMIFGRCMTWECVNENYYKTGMLVNPKFDISKGEADVDFQFVSGIFVDENYFHLIKENNAWRITHFLRPIN